MSFVLWFLISWQKRFAIRYPAFFRRWFVSVASGLHVRAVRYFSLYLFSVEISPYKARFHWTSREFWLSETSLLPRLPDLVKIFQTSVANKVRRRNRLMNIAAQTAIRWYKTNKKTFLTHTHFTKNVLFAYLISDSFFIVRWANLNTENKQTLGNQVVGSNPLD